MLIFFSFYITDLCIFHLSYNSKVEELTDIHRRSNDENELSRSDSEKLLKDCAFRFQVLLKFRVLSCLI